jgi:NADH:ubiquinone oxidoreductase subunit F (NADH-binding)/(2Fe-2S) ferredoxin/Pyruvate/2-oxoacid:ferredoxin oxidoreductase delta subunit
MAAEERTVLICRGTGCESTKSPAIQAALDTALRDSDVEVKFTGCHGMCQQGPIVIVEPEGTFYANVKEKDAPAIVDSLLNGNQPVERLYYKDPATDEQLPTYRDIPFYSKQKRRILRNCGRINPEEISDYVNAEGYQGLKKALFELSPEEIVSTVKQSGLRGRGGGGFSTGMKWQFCQEAEGDTKYVLCNADEGDPGAFMDRSVLEGDPHAVLEGMAIAGSAIGARQGYIYCRAEYPLAIKRLQVAIKQAREQGYLGKGIMGSDFDFDIEIFQGAGAFVCGEETALIISIEGKRGMPRVRPPFPAHSGLNGKPTLLNNVKSYANISLIIRNGADWFASIGTENSKGTAVFALTGKIANSGLIEVPMGSTPREIIYDIGGGILNGKKFKAVQTGGPSGGCLPESFLDLPVDYDSLIEAGSMMGSGGMVVLDEDTCMVEVARYFLDFTERESCGKCVPCRLGTKQMLSILEDIVEGRGRPEDIDTLEEMGAAIKAGSLCGLGQTAPNPVLTTLRYFREEYEAHIFHNACPAKQCKEFISYHILETCVGCGLCLKNCSSDAITGERKKLHSIDQDKCNTCGVCFEVCPPKVFSVEIRTGETEHVDVSIGETEPVDA